MNYYEKKIGDHGTIYLIKKTINLNNYYIIDENPNYLIIKPIILINDVNDLDLLDKSEFNINNVVHANVNDRDIDSDYLRPVLIDTYLYINDGAAIIKNSLLNIKTIKFESMGYFYLEDLGISFQSNDIKLTLKEIFMQCYQNDISLNLLVEDTKK